MQNNQENNKVEGNTSTLDVKQKKVMSKSKKIHLIVGWSMFIAFILILLILGIVHSDHLVEQLKDSFPNPSKNILSLLNGLGTTMLITVCAFLMGVILGFITCLILNIKSDNPFVIFIQNIFKTYVAIFRGTPMVVQLLIIYFIILSPLHVDSLYVAIIAFGLNSGAYVSEIIRGGINSVPKGQTEAGRSLGLNYPQVMARIIFPQALRNALPSLGNELITLVKETSIVSFVAVVDLTKAFQSLATATYDYTTVYLVMGVTYFVIVYILTKLLSLLERRLMKYAKR